jgi:hypothetical protein
VVKRGRGRWREGGGIEEVVKEAAGINREGQTTSKHNVKHRTSEFPCYGLFCSFTQLNTYLILNT